MSNFDEMRAREDVIMAALHVLQAERGSEDDAHFDDAREYAREGLALAARALYLAVEGLPREERPIGWNKKPHNSVVPVMLTAADLDALAAGLMAREQTYAVTNSDLKQRLKEERIAFDRHPETPISEDLPEL